MIVAQEHPPGKPDWLHRALRGNCSGSTSSFSSGRMGCCRNAVRFVFIPNSPTLNLTTNPESLMLSIPPSNPDSPLSRSLPRLPVLPLARSTVAPSRVTMLLGWEHVRHCLGMLVPSFHREVNVCVMLDVMEHLERY